MFTLKQAKAKAAFFTELHGEPWLVFKVPASAPCNEHPANVYNTGKYSYCKASERADYEAGGAVFMEVAS